MASLSHSHLTDFYTQKACKEASSSMYNNTTTTTTNNINSMQSLYSLMHTLHPKYPHSATAPPHHEFNMSAKPFYYSSNVHGLMSKGNGQLNIEEPSLLSTTHANSTVTSPSLDDQVSSFHHPQKQAAMECKAPLSASASASYLGGSELHVNAAKKRIRAVMDCKDPDNENQGKKRTKTNSCDTYPRRRTEVTTEVKHTITKAISPLKKNSISEQKSPETKSNVTKDSNPTLEQLEPPTKPDFIHVRARRGQATDSHSLAERVRREKISERMKYLQDLVPSCIKVTGKAMMLDEIINYVQSLQRQVEFLSMKLAAVPPSRLEFSFDSLFGKKVVQPNNNVNGINTHIPGSGEAVQAFAPPTEYIANNIQSGFVNTILRSNEIFQESVRPHVDVNSTMQLQAPNHIELNMACSPPADAFFANLSSELGVDDALVHHTSAAGSSSCSLVASPTLDPAQHSCISQSLEMEWDDDLQNIVQQMGCFSQANSSWLPADHLLNEGFFMQGNLMKEEL